MDLSMFSLEGKVALITGGSRGIGRASALALAGAVVFPASAAGSYIPGETIVIDGGRVHGEPAHLKKK